MPRGPRKDFSELEKRLRLHLANSISNVKDACTYLGISQPTFSRLLSRLPEDFLKFGKASQTRYALRRNISGVGDRFPIYQIKPDGKSSKMGVLHAIYPRGFYLEQPLGRTFSDLPYFLDDLRPSGFLGRLIPKRHPELNLSKDIREWAADDCLRYLTIYGHDLIGNFILGEAAFQRYLDIASKKSVLIGRRERKEKYRERAIDVIKFGDPGSSAGGEQPKFFAVLGPTPTPVLVKFSPRLENNVSQRRADLIVCEHLALETLRKYKQTSAESEIVLGDKQVFLEIKRFDRVQEFGRRGVISLRALDAEFVGKAATTWVEISEALFERGIIDYQAVNQMRWRELFGHLIANTDMHSANASFFFEYLKVSEIAPVYDMLPMLYAPQNEEVIPREFEPPAPRPSDGRIWGEVWTAACEFWKIAGEDLRISFDFRKIARANLRKLLALKSVQKLLPH